MAHTLNDLVIRGCDEDEEPLRRGRSLDGLEALRAETRYFEHEADELRGRLSARLAELALKAGGGSNATAAGGVVSPLGEARGLLAAALPSLLGAVK